MLRRTSHIFLELIAALIVGVLLLMLVATWRLSQGPVSLGFLKPYVDEQLVALEGPLKIEIDDMILKWAGWDRALDIVVLGAKASARDGGPIASAPEVSVSISALPLLRGVIAPTSLELISPKLNIVRTRSGRFELGVGVAAGESGALMSFVTDALLQRPERFGATGRLKRISVTGGNLTVEDHANGVTWGAPHADILLSRESEGIGARFDLDMDFADHRPSLRGTARYAWARNDIDVKAHMENWRADLLAARIKSLAPLKGLRVPIAGDIELKLDAAGAVRRATYDLTGGAGIVDLPDPHLRGLPVRSVGARGSFDRRPTRLVIERLKVDLGGPNIEASAVVTRTGDRSNFSAEAMTRDFPTSLLPRYWPPHVAKPARKWVLENITGGGVSEMRTTLSGRLSGANGDQVDLDNFESNLVAENLTMHYMKPLPPVRGVGLRATLKPTRVDLNIQRGGIDGLRITEGTVAMTDLEKPDSKFDLELVFHGPLSDALGVLDRPPLGFATAMGFAPERTKGIAAVRLVTRMPLATTLTLDQVDIKAAANLRDVAVAKSMFDVDLTEGALSLQLDRKGMVIDGNLRMDGIPGALTWYENFTDKSEYSRRYDIKARLDDAQRERLGLVVGSRLSGPVDAEMSYVVSSDTKRGLSARLDLGAAALSLPLLDWSKPPGQPGTAKIDLEFSAEDAPRLGKIEISGNELNAHASFTFNPDGETIRSVHLDRFVLADRYDLSGNLRRQSNDALVVALEGPKLDARPFINLDGDSVNGGLSTPLRLYVNAGEVRLGENAAVQQVQAVIHHDGKIWRRIAIDGAADGGNKFSASYRNSPGARAFAVKSANAGAVLRALGLIGSVRGGRLSLTAKRPGAEAASPWKGRLEINDFSLTRAPFMARLLTLSSLTGISDVLSGKGIRFRQLDMPFALQSGRLTLGDSRAVGAESGVTATGFVDLEAEQVDLEGTLVPAYTINSLLGNIPLLGKLFTGSKGSGVFAATYGMKGPFKKTEITVNPLAALAPGFLRDLISGLEKVGTEPIGPPEPVQD